MEDIRSDSFTVILDVPLDKSKEDMLKKIVTDMPVSLILFLVGSVKMHIVMKPPLSIYDDPCYLLSYVQTLFDAAGYISLVLLPEYIDDILYKNGRYYTNIPCHVSIGDKYGFVGCIRTREQRIMAIENYGNVSILKKCRTDFFSSKVTVSQLEDMTCGIQGTIVNDTAQDISIKDG